MTTADVEAQPGSVSDADPCCDGADVLMPVVDAQRLSSVFKALSDPTRVQLLRYLAQSSSGTACACHVPAALGITQPTLSFHIKKLRDAGLVTRERRGRWMHYTVRRESLEEVRSFLDMPESHHDCC